MNFSSTIHPMHQSIHNYCNALIHKGKKYITMTPNSRHPNKRTRKKMILRNLALAAFVGATAFGFVDVHHYHHTTTVSSNFEAVDHQTPHGIIPHTTYNHPVISESSSPTVDGGDKKMDNKKASPPYAYMFIIGGVHEDRRSGYQGFLYNVLIARDILMELGSKADMWIYIRFSPDSKLGTLPREDLEMLKNLDIQVRYLEKPERDSFGDTVLEKFHALEMTQYRRVMFLDADVLPLVNMDYLFQLSDDGNHPILKPNVVVATRGEPANGGCFILEPQTGAYQELQNIIYQQRESARKLKKFPFFDRTNGWGYSFKQHNDTWNGIFQSGNRWNFHGAHVDQGLLLYWTKYYRQEVSVFMGDKIENYGPGKDGRPFKESEIDTVKDIQPFLKSLPLALQHKCDTHASNNKMCLPPYSSYAHFTGSKKPWQEGFSKYRVRRTDNKELEGPYRLYYQRLFQLSERFSWGIDSDTVSAKFKNMKESVLGYMPSLHDHANHIQRHRNATMGL